MAKKCTMMNRNKRTGRFQKSATKGSKRVKVCFTSGGRRTHRGRTAGRRAGGFVCISRKTGRFTQKVKGNKCRKGSKRSRSF